MLVNEILFEEDKYGRTRSLTIEEARALMPRLQVAIHKVSENNQIYRGSPNSEQIVYTDPTTVERKSRNTSNEYTLLFSHILPSWSKWPKRSRSLICSEIYSYARGYTHGSGKAEPFIVMPLDNPKIAICPHSDFWASFKIKPDALNSILRDMFAEARQLSDQLPDTTTADGIANMLKAFDDMDSQAKETIFHNVRDGNSFYARQIEQVIKMLESGNAIAALSQFFDPAKNGFELVDYNNYKSTSNNEVWISAPCVLLRPAAFDQVFN